MDRQRSLVSQWRRAISVLFLTIVSALLCAPAALQAVAPTFHVVPGARNFVENRTLNSPPQWPRKAQDVTELMTETDRWLQDSFGLRADLITLDNWLRFHLFGEFQNQQVVVGPTGRFFFTTPDTRSPFVNVRLVCGIGVDGSRISAAVAQLSTLVRSARQDAHQILVLAIPTSLSLYQKELPRWLSRQCATAQPTMSRLQTALPSDIEDEFDYPIAVAQELPSTEALIPKINFHWAGSGVQRLMEEVSEDKLHRARVTTTPKTIIFERSDLVSFTPGLTFVQAVDLPDWRSAGIEECWGSRCFPELGDIAVQLVDLSRYRNPRAKGRVLLVSDLFGRMGAGFLAEYFGEVRHIATNYMARLTPIQLARVRQYFVQDYRPDTIILMFNDGAMLYAPGQALGYLWPS